MSDFPGCSTDLRLVYYSLRRKLNLRCVRACKESEDSSQKTNIVDSDVNIGRQRSALRLLVRLSTHESIQVREAKAQSLTTVSRGEWLYAGNTYSY